MTDTAVVPRKPDRPRADDSPACSRIATGECSTLGATTTRAARTPNPARAAAVQGAGWEGRAYGRVPRRAVKGAGLMCGRDRGNAATERVFTLDVDLPGRASKVVLRSLDGWSWAGALD